MKLSHLGWQYDLQNSNTFSQDPRTRHEKSCFEWLIRMSKRNPIMIDYCFCPWLLSPTGRRQKPQWLRISWTSDIGTRSPWAGTDQNASSLRASFQGTRRRKTTNRPAQLWCLWTPTMTSMAGEPIVSSSGVHTWMVADGSLVGLKTHSARRKSCLVLEI